MSVNDYKLDQTDRTILNLLIKDARTQYLKIAQACNMTSAGIHKRIRNLKKAGIITGAEITLDSKNIGYPTLAFIGLQMSLETTTTHIDVFKHIKDIPEIVECYDITGKYSLFIKVYANSNEHLRQIIVEKIQSIKEVTATETFICLEEGFKRQLPF
ncbi:MAG: Lrp/AsnC ligand binding domain-containing protein [Bacteroidota bacterium]|nr:Lrp/AsnC ligand binding domain-containing protein [Bacteroidota bacterium]